MVPVQENGKPALYCITFLTSPPIINYYYYYILFQAEAALKVRFHPGYGPNMIQAVVRWEGKELDIRDKGNEEIKYFTNNL